MDPADVGFVSVVVVDSEPSPLDVELILEWRTLGPSSLEMARRWERRRGGWWWWNPGDSAVAPGRISRHGAGYGAALTWRAAGSQSIMEVDKDVYEKDEY